MTKRKIRCRQGAGSAGGARVDPPERRRYSRRVHTLEPELEALRREGALDEAAASRAVAAERGDPMSLHAEIRALLYSGVLLVVAGVGTLLARHLDRIGPATIVLAVALVAVAAAIPALRAHRAGEPLPVVSDYLLLLAVLLGAADLAYAESQFALLGPAWSWHFAIVAAASAALAYRFESKLVLAVSLTSLAAWFGVGTLGPTVARVPSGGADFGGRALTCAMLIAAWNAFDGRLRPLSRFGAVFDHYAANLAFWGALAWCLDDRWRWAGVPVLAMLSALSIRHGRLAQRESFVVYGVVYAALGACFTVVPHLGDETVALSFALVAVCVAALSLWQLLRRIRERG